MFYLKISTFYFNILFKNIRILFQCFILKTSTFYFNVLFKNVKILFQYFFQKHQHFFPLLHTRTQN